jgi:2-oxoglutarate ferredoxin oxidoreductase subunit delta
MSETTTVKKPRKVKGKIEIDIQKCKGCEMCTIACKEDSIKLSKEINNLGYRYAVFVNAENCTGCENCALICPDGIIKVYRTTGKKKELVAKVSNVKSNIVINIDENPSAEDLRNMDYI